MNPNQFYYLIEAECPDCELVNRIVEVRSAPVDLMQDVGISVQYCQHCGNHVGAFDDGWDLQQDHEIESVDPHRHK